MKLRQHPIFLEIHQLPPQNHDNVISALRNIYGVNCPATFLALSMVLNDFSTMDSSSVTSSYHKNNGSSSVYVRIISLISVDLGGFEGIIYIYGAFCSLYIEREYQGSSVCLYYFCHGEDPARSKPICLIK